MAFIDMNFANGGGGGTTDYSALSNKPTINNVELSGNKTSSDLGIASASDIDSWFGTSTSADGTTVSFSGIDNDKAYDVYAENKLVSITDITINGTTITYTLSGASAGDSFRLRQINN